MFFLALSFYFWYCLYLAMLVRQVRRLHFFQSMKKRSKKISPNQTPPSNNDLAGLAGCLAGQPPACGGVGRKEGNPLQGLASAKPPSKKVVVDFTPPLLWQLHPLLCRPSIHLATFGVFPILRRQPFWLAQAR